ncbi:hypothetical protein AFEL58S_00081 [Afipia felis]
MLNTDRDILKAAEDGHKAGCGVALAIVAETLGVGSTSGRLQPHHQRPRLVPRLGCWRLRRGCRCFRGARRHYLGFDIGAVSPAEIAVSIMG